MEFLEKHETAHVTELKVALEDKYYHWITENALKKLFEGPPKRLKRRIRAWAEGRTATFYFLSDRTYSELAPKIEQKLPIVAEYSKLGEVEKPGEKPGIKAEDFIISCFVEAGYTVVARETRFFNGQTYPQGKTLDLIVYGREENRWYGVQIKNRLQYPPWDTAADLVDMCNYLGLVPWFVKRWWPKCWIWDLITSGGFVTLFPDRKWLLTEQYAQTARRIRENTQIPVTLPEELEDFRKLMVEDLKLIHKQPRRGKGGVSIE